MNRIHFNSDEMLEQVLPTVFASYCTIPLDFKFNEEAIEWAKMRNHQDPITKPVLWR